MGNKPIKRHKSLQPFSREHHFALLLCWKIRRGLELEVDPQRIGNYLQKMWEHQLSGHFDMEEQFVFPILDYGEKLVKEAIKDHRLIKRLILIEPFTVKTLNRIEEKLEGHIRMEERQLFPLVQKQATEEQFLAIERAHQMTCSELDWEDQFWDI